MTATRVRPGAEVVIFDLHVPAPVYHRVPEWTGVGAPGRRGEEEVCNVLITRDGRRVGCTRLPESVVAPCGRPIYRRAPNFVAMVPDREWPVTTDNPKVMTPQGKFIPLRHAAKFATPCRRCFPDA
jgi:hypothetical protein